MRAQTYYIVLAEARTGAHMAARARARKRTRTHARMQTPILHRCTQGEQVLKQ